MGVLSLCRKSRYLLKPSYLYCTSLCPHSKTLPSSTPVSKKFTHDRLFLSISGSNPTYSAISLTGYPSFYQVISSTDSKSSFLSTFSCGSIWSGRSAINSFASIRCSSNFCIPNISLLRYFSPIRLFSSSTDNISAKTVKTFGSNEHLEYSRFGVISGDINGIIDIIKGDGSDMELRLYSVGSNFTRWDVIEILRVLNVTKVPALRFFEWDRDVHPNHSRNSDICSLMVDNCGRLGDYATMVSLLKEFQARNICLSDKAFGFLHILSSTKEAAKQSIRVVIGVLNEVGGSCRNSGIHSLIEMLCSLNLFDLTKFAMEITERNVSYYNVLVHHICKRRQFEEARHMLEEMRKMGCYPDSKTYNYLISSLCKQGSFDEASALLEEMLEGSCPPDLISFEILIYFACRYRRSEHAVKFYNQMVSSGIKPRFRTVNAFVRGYFKSQQFEEAYKFVVDTAAQHKWSAEEIYIELARLHLKDGDLLVAHNLLLEMIEKGLKPKYSVFRGVSKRLYKTGKEQFAINLKERFSRYMLKFGHSAG